MVSTLVWSAAHDARSPDLAFLTSALHDGFHDVGRLSARFRRASSDSASLRYMVLDYGAVAHPRHG